MDVSEFGRMPDGRPVHGIVLGAAPGPVVHLITLGASVHRLEVTCGDGHRRNVVLGHAAVADRLASSDYLGSTVGRYANRIAGGRFRLGDLDVRLATNDRGNSLHGGTDGFDRRVWDLVDAGRDHAHLRLVSPDGDMGFPGTVTADAHYRVEGDSVRIRLEATTDQPTLVNLTNHAYFNLDGEDAGTIDRHRLTLDADEYTPVDAGGIPTGRHEAVDGTPFDFRSPRPIGPAVRRRTPQVELARGIDHNYVIRGDGLRTAAVLESPGTGTRLELSTDQPGLQVYTGNFLDGSRPSISGGLYRQGDGIALEPQLFPDSPHHPEWPSAVLQPGDRYEASIGWTFGPLHTG
ncbi:MAG TPA: aldose epimerase family protein [Nocardioides sp.]|nr:aldose epimerase family protein [Nocardioides sp.]